MHACDRVPITAVEVKLGGEWLPLKRTVNNQWPYYNTNGPWQSSFPMPIRVTSVTGETIEDTITSAKGGDGSKQFSAVGGSVRPPMPYTHVSCARLASHSGDHPMHPCPDTAHDFRGPHVSVAEQDKTRQESHF